jgi:hypothetical protein
MNDIKFIDRALETVSERGRPTQPPQRGNREIADSHAVEIDRHIERDIEISSTVDTGCINVYGVPAGSQRDG